MKTWLLDSLYIVAGTVSAMLALAYTPEMADLLVQWVFTPMIEAMGGLLTWVLVAF